MKEEEKEEKEETTSVRETWLACGPIETTEPMTTWGRDDIVAKKARDTEGLEARSTRVFLRTRMASAESKCARATASPRKQRA